MLVKIAKIIKRISAKLSKSFRTNKNIYNYSLLLVLY